MIPSSIQLMKKRRSNNLRIPKNPLLNNPSLSINQLPIPMITIISPYPNIYLHIIILYYTVSMSHIIVVLTIIYIYTWYPLQTDTLSNIPMHLTHIYRAILIPIHTIFATLYFIIIDKSNTLATFNYFNIFIVIILAN